MLPVPLSRIFGALLAGLIASLPSFGLAQGMAGMAWRLHTIVDLGAHGWNGIAADQHHNLYLSDTDGNMLLRMSHNGKLDTLSQELDRPMHLSIDPTGKFLLIAEYGADRIARWSIEGGTMISPLQGELDAPSGADWHSGTAYVADFYNHRVAVLDPDGKQWQIGRKGKGKGQLDYPTDVQVAGGLVWVADAYNHRVQAFSMSGKAKRILGQGDGIQAAIGLHVTEDGSVFVTDFEHSRILGYDAKGRLRTTLTEGLEKPSDLVVSGKYMYIVNYKGRSITIYTISTP